MAAAEPGNERPAQRRRRVSRIVPVPVPPPPFVLLPLGTRQLPEDLTLAIQQFMPVETILNLCQSNRQWAELCRNEEFWHQIMKKYFPVVVADWEGKQQQNPAIIIRWQREFKKQYWLQRLVPFWTGQIIQQSGLLTPITDVEAMQLHGRITKLVFNVMTEEQTLRSLEPILKLKAETHLAVMADPPVVDTTLQIGLAKAFFPRTMQEIASHGEVHEGVAWELLQWVRHNTGGLSAVDGWVDGTFHNLERLCTVLLSEILLKQLTGTPDTMRQELNMTVEVDQVLSEFSVLERDPEIEIKDSEQQQAVDHALEVLQDTMIYAATSHPPASVRIQDYGIDLTVSVVTNEEFGEEQFSIIQHVTHSAEFPQTPVVTTKLYMYAYHHITESLLTSEPLSLKLITPGMYQWPSSPDLQRTTFLQLLTKLGFDQSTRFGLGVSVNVVKDIYYPQ